MNVRGCLHTGAYTLLVKASNAILTENAIGISEEKKIVIWLVFIHTSFIHRTKVYRVITNKILLPHSMP